MGIKNFHLVFIALSILTALMTGLWCITTEAGRALEGSAAMSAVLLVASVVLTIYAVRFVRKVQQEGLE